MSKVTGRGIYVASKVAHAEMWRDLRQFEQEPIISTWIDEAGVGESASLEDLWRRCVAEASNAGALIVYRRPDEVLKGAWVEMGAALANGVPVFAVGIEEFTVANHAGITHCADLIEARKLARAALEAASSTPDGEAVAWRWRNYPGGWQYTGHEDMAPSDRREPLYAHPAPIKDWVTVKDGSDEQ